MKTMNDSAERMSTQVTESDHDAALMRRARDAVADDVRILAALHDREVGLELLAYLRESDFPARISLADASARMAEGVTLLSEFLDAIGDSPEGWVFDELAADYAAIYLNHKYLASPCESVWVDDEGLALQDATFQIRSWYRRFGLAVENWRTRSDDHLVVQLHFLEILLRRSDDVDIAEIGRFMDEHLLRWLPHFASRVAERCATRFYAAAALLTDAYFEQLRELIVQITGESRPTAAEIEQRMKPKAEVKAAPLVFHPGSGPSW